MLHLFLCNTTIFPKLSYAFRVSSKSITFTYTYCSYDLSQSLQNFFNSVSLATENYFYLLYTKNIKRSDSYERTLHILYHARPMVSTFVRMSAFFQQLSVKKASANDGTISMIILIVNTERIRTWIQ